MKALLLLVIALVVAGVVGDVAAKRVAEKRIAAQVEDSIEGVNRVEVEIGGFPFLPALLSGRLDELRLQIPRVRARGLSVSDLRLDLDELEFEPVDVFAGSGQIRVAGGSGYAYASGGAITRALRRSGTDASLAFEGSETTITIQGQTHRVGSVDVSDGNLVFDLPTGPVSLAIPATFESVRYESARVEGGRLRIDLVLSGKRLEL